MVTLTSVFHTHEEWKHWKTTYCRDSTYCKFYISDPKSYPCIGIEESQPVGDLGTRTVIDVFVYPSNFVSSVKG
jgi:hypothetical protein